MQRKTLNTNQWCIDCISKLWHCISENDISRFSSRWHPRMQCPYSTNQLSLRNTSFPEPAVIEDFKSFQCWQHMEQDNNPISKKDTKQVTMQLYIKYSKDTIVDVKGLWINAYYQIYNIYIHFHHILEWGNELKHTKIGFNAFFLLFDRPLVNCSLKMVQVTRLDPGGETASLPWSAAHREWPWPSSSIS